MAPKDLSLIAFLVIFQFTHFADGQCGRYSQGQKLQPAGRNSCDGFLKIVRGRAIIQPLFSFSDQDSQLRVDFHIQNSADYVSIRSHNQQNLFLSTLNSRAGASVRVRSDFSTIRLSCPRVNCRTDDRLFTLRSNSATKIVFGVEDGPRLYVSSSLSSRPFYSPTPEPWILFSQQRYRGAGFAGLTTVQVPRSSYIGSNLNLVISGSSSRLAVLSSRDASRSRRSFERTFETDIWRYYKSVRCSGPAPGRDLDVGRVIVLRRQNSDDYVSFDLNRGTVTLPERFCFWRTSCSGYRCRKSHSNLRNTSYRSQRQRSSHRRKYTPRLPRYPPTKRCIRYQKVTLQSCRKQGFGRRGNRRVLTTDVRQIEFPDERFWEVVDQEDGTVRLRSAIDLTKYLAILQTSPNTFETVITDLNPQSGLSFNFQISFPVLRPSRREQLLEIPCEGTNRRQSPQFGVEFTCSPPSSN